MTREEKSGIDEMSLALGARLGGIEKSLEIIVRTLSEDRVAAANYRTDIRAELKAVNAEVAGAKTEIQDAKADIRSATETLTELRPKVLLLEQKAAMVTGASKLAEFIWRTFYGLVGGAIVVAVEHFFLPHR